MQYTHKKDHTIKKINHIEEIDKDTIKGSYLDPISKSPKVDEFKLKDLKVIEKKSEEDVKPVPEYDASHMKGAKDMEIKDNSETKVVKASPVKKKSVKKK